VVHTPKPFRLQDRDIAALVGLFESRVMTISQIAEIYFDGKRETAKKHLQTLKAEGLVGERARWVNEPSVLHLSRLGLSVLSDRGLLAGYPGFGLSALVRRTRVSGLTLDHELEVMDVKAAFHARARSTATLSVAEFTTWPLLSQFKTSGNITVKPDGFIRIREKKEAGTPSDHVFFLEQDRSTENQTTLVSRARCYLDYYKSGGFAQKHGATRSAFKDYPFRVLMVFKSAERRNNIAEQLLQLNPPILTLVWLATFDEVKADPLGAIWIRPIDYRDAVEGTKHDVKRRQSPPGYRRQTDRDLFIEERVERHCLFTGTTMPVRPSQLLLSSHGKIHSGRLHDRRGDGAIGKGEGITAIDGRASLSPGPASPPAGAKEIETPHNKEAYLN
jgi:hypothetical protein